MKVEFNQWELEIIHWALYEQINTDRCSLRNFNPHSLIFLADKVNTYLEGDQNKKGVK
jgi:hypothetical protein